jgi:hypothetical protein
LGIPDLRNPITFPPIPFTTGFASFQIPVGDPSLQYWIDLDIVPGNGGNIYVGDWNETYDVGIYIPNPISFTNGATTTVALRGSLGVHQRPP